MTPQIAVGICMKFNFIILPACGKCPKGGHKFHCSAAWKASIAIVSAEGQKMMSEWRSWRGQTANGP